MTEPDRLPVSSKPTHIGELVSAFEDEPFADAIDRLIWNGHRSDATAFERYAVRELEASDVAQLRRISAQYPLRVVRLDNGSAWIAVPGEMPTDDRMVVHAVEAALTRLFAADAMACSLDEGQGLLTTLTDADLGELDSLILGDWRERMQFVRRQPDLDVDRSEQYMGDGDWGAMLKCCAVSESIVLPLHYEYRCDFDRASGTMGIVFQAPTADQFSRYVYDGCGCWSLLSDERRAARASAYTLLLAGVVAQVGFSAHAGTRTVWVTAYADSVQRMERPVVSLTVDRADFDARVAPKYAAGLDDVVVDGDAEGALRVLRAAGACSVRLDALTGALDVIQPLPLPQPLLDGRTPYGGTTVRCRRICNVGCMRSTRAHWTPNMMTGSSPMSRSHELNRGTGTARSSWRPSLSRRSPGLNRRCPTTANSRCSASMRTNARRSACCSPRHPRSTGARRSRCITRIWRSRTST
ncbi:hypothetical protein [uncultured Bifidobacterium sp.]|uniref:hypothetical protein n=1 Tax=uncultured Bifidobacterium sp. TaxID=165187 RepID=UPI00259AB506|nr:hypothetical protein [uncultured Bifidobacterium sp.]